MTNALPTNRVVFHMPYLVASGEWSPGDMETTPILAHGDSQSGCCSTSGLTFEVLVFGFENSRIASVE